MGTYLNPDNTMFRGHLKNKFYVDKSGLIEYTNECIESEDDKYICVSRPRRFGKSYAADMLKAYYSRGCDSRDLFEGLSASKLPSFDTHLNKYNVIYFDIAQIIKKDVDAETGLAELNEELVHELRAEHRFMFFRKRKLIPMLEKIYKKTHKGFVFIIDEWDCPLRERKDDTRSQELYLQFLKDLFKNRAYVSLAYMTGILPIRKYGEHSALNMFKEISMTGADPVQEYMGFTVKEVKKLCGGNKKLEAEIKKWYNGYTVDGMDIYNPYSVGQAMRANPDLPMKGYWTATETYRALEVYIRTNTYGVQDVLSGLMEGKSVGVDISGFTNDMVTFDCRDDVLTLLIHLGYLSYDSLTKTVRIPNLELKEQFKSSLLRIGLGSYDETRIDSEKVFEATLAADAKKVASYFHKIHQRRTAVRDYNRELSLKCAVQFAYLVAEEYYNDYLELPAGDGFADVGYIPKNSENPVYPPMVVELKIDKSAEGALAQIEEKEYYNFMPNYHGDVILVGINYDDKTKDHTCVIRKAVK
ncbi:MAG: AAA family ATPase [Clostridia bacterium]|nr:AAA family ATPase [Clostridia bacterium]